MLDDESFYLIGKNGFYVKEENKRFIAVGTCCRQSLKSEVFMASFGRLRQRNSVVHVWHDYSS